MTQVCHRDILPMPVNPELFDVAFWSLSQSTASEKAAFTPPPAPGADPTGGGALPTAPADPAMAATAPPPPAPAPAPAPVAAPAAAPVAGKPAKPDIGTVAMDVFQLKKIVMHGMQTLFSAMNIPWDLPPDVLDGPNRDPQTGMPMAPGAPGSTSDPAAIQQAAQGGAQGAAPPSAIPPIQPMQGAFPSSPDAGAAKAGATQAPRPPRGVLAALFGLEERAA